MNTLSHMFQETPFNGFFSRCDHSHEKQKDSLKSGLDRVLFVAELEFLKILVSRLAQYTSNVNL